MQIFSEGSQRRQESGREWEPEARLVLQSAPEKGTLEYIYKIDSSFHFLHKGLLDRQIGWAA